MRLTAFEGYGDQSLSEATDSAIVGCVNVVCKKASVGPDKINDVYLSTWKNEKHVP